jgi:hypothetical protein
MAELAVLAATSLGASASTAATIGTIASVGMTAASSFGSLSAGSAQADALNIQARQSSLNARTERLEGRRQSLAIQEQLDKDLASQNAIFAARGVLEGEGSAEAASEAAKKNASRDINLARFNSELTALSDDQSAANSRADAKAAKQQGIFDAVGALSGLSITKAPTGGGGSTPPIPKRKPTLLSGI